MKKVAWSITDNNITVNYDGQTHIVTRDAELADQLIEAIRNKNYDEVPRLVSVAQAVEDFSNGNFVVKNGEIFVNGVVAPTVLGNKIVKFAREGLPHEPLVKFAENLQKNPSYRAVQELFTFLEKNDHPITENGNFIAYKKVREDFTDCHTGKFDNSVGKTLEMPRNEVDEDRDRTCSYGFHAANWSYANDFYGNGIMLEVEINPADVVSIPSDYNDAKMRVCKYKVLGVVDKEHSSDLGLRKTETLSCCDHSCDEDDYEENVRECCDCGEELELDYPYDYCDDCADSCEAEDEYPYDDELCDDLGCEHCNK
jgi:hypothetical protein